MERMNPRYILIVEPGKIPLKKRGPVDGDLFRDYLTEIVRYYPLAEVVVVDLPFDDLWVTSASEWLAHEEACRR